MAPSRALVRSAAALIHKLPQTQSQSAFLVTTHRTPILASRNRPQSHLTQYRHYTTNPQETQPSSTPPTPPTHLTPGERAVFDKILSELEPVALEVQDVSGGCGSMYALEIVSPRFNGLSVMKQHRLVNAVLKEEIGGWHGVQLRTRGV